MTPLDTLAYIVRHPLSSRRPIKGVYRYVDWQIRCRIYPELKCLSDEFLNRMNRL